MKTIEFQLHYKFFKSIFIFFDSVWCHLLFLLFFTFSLFYFLIFPFLCFPFLICILIQFLSSPSISPFLFPLSVSPSFLLPPCSVWWAHCWHCCVCQRPLLSAGSQHFSRGAPASPPTFKSPSNRIVEFGHTQPSHVPTLPSSLSFFRSFFLSFFKFLCF